MNTRKTSEKTIKVPAGERDAWGYAVCFGTIITFIGGIGHVNSFGLIYHDFILETASSAKSLTTAHGVFAIMLAIGGFILNMVTKKYSLRTGGLIGTALFSTGSFLTIFISNTYQLPLTFGLLQGIGFGMMVTVSYATLNHYFIKKRTTVMSICKALQGIILILYPQILKKFMSFYGFRGTLLLVSGISLHTLPGMLVMKKNLEKNIIMRAANDIESLKDKDENKDLLRTNDTPQDVNTKDVSMKKKWRGKLLETFNIKVLKDPIYLNMCIGQSFVNFSDLTFFILQPMLLFQYGYDKTQVATCISICAGADVAGRCGLAIVSNIVNINTRFLYYVASLFTLLIRIVILQTTDFVWVACVTATLGMLRAWLHVASPLVISNYVTHEDFPGAYAIFMLAAGVINVMCSPLIGQLKDVYGDYVPAFYALTLCCIPCVLFWPLEYCIKTKLTKA
ncbi:hypothetical protein K1T71_001703 [Dendrolimus kikuchii]|uniref:Uncharacterized protein n=1 Tax=Dendrolimus kikuchii TaxID=765133 RepID=A0ACC1DF21_9NEOP|nr:hypothetical protein K1T71_001703 [Dendrolimus kikuchii]